MDDIRTYCRIVTALKLTIDIQTKINTLYPRAESKIVILSECADLNQSKRPTRPLSGRGKPRR